MLPEHATLNWQGALLLLGAALGLCALAAALAAAGGRLLIPWLVKKKLNDGEPRKASEYLNLLQGTKKNTPTMGGAFLVPAVLLAAAFGGLGLWLLGGDGARIGGALGLGALVLGASAGLGLVDDYTKLTKRGRDGISGKAKLAVQTLVALAACAGAAWLVGDDGRVLHLPFATIHIGWWMVPLGMFVMVGSSNAYNLTDGLDGLAGGTGTLAFYALGGAAVLAALFGAGGDGAWSAGVLGIGAAGALLGFLYWNRHPAKVFMGDTGSLALGSLLGYIAVLARLEMVLAVAGGVFVAEAASVMLQVGYFKATKGKRILRCAPLHHHFQFGGWHETRVTSRFTRAGMVLALAALALLPLLLKAPASGDQPQPVAETAPQRAAPDAVVQR
ncbi:MAG: phospho-N-acetylmuramoyl-pentapeptide-transferase [Planctomycetes bacterium]|nr:phospho-N-acetylmuramoyl-pentapeptide-transferase [Planctomycetota bacterium]